MLGCTACTLALPESINYRKSTLREYAMAEHEKMEKASIELVELKTMEESKDVPENSNQAAVGNDAMPDVSSNVVISVQPKQEENHTETLVGNDSPSEV